MYLIDLEVNHYLNDYLITSKLALHFIKLSFKWDYVHSLIQRDFKINLKLLQLDLSQNNERLKGKIYCIWVLISQRAVTFLLSFFYFSFHPKRKSFLVLLSKWMEIKMKLKINREEIFRLLSAGDPNIQFVIRFVTSITLIRI